MQNQLFSTKPDTESGFEKFWSMYPRDKDHPGRKSNKVGCLRIWKKNKLHKVREQVYAALKEDIEAIKKGTYAFTVDSTDKMHYFKGIVPWLNQNQWDRDLEEAIKPPKLPPIVVEPERERMTQEEFLNKQHDFRKLAGMNHP